MRPLRATWFVLSSCLLAGIVQAAEAPAIIPRPAMLTPADGVFRLSADTTIVAGPLGGAREVGVLLAGAIERSTGLKLEVRSGVATAEDKRVIVLEAGGSAGTSPEAYELEVTPERITLRASDPGGLFRGVQSLRQLLPPEAAAGQAAPRAGAEAAVACVKIVDAPLYRHRGMLLDCGRHFMSKDFVKRYIDLLAFHKMNVLHWHLTEDQGWRIEIKKYPKLTEIGAWRGEGADRYGGFYTQEDVKEVVAYAKSRFITVIPEIEMPGHSLAALTSYPELSCTGGPFTVGTRWGVYDDVYCAGSDRTFEFLQDVLLEVMALFPSEYIHIGGDECPKTRWKSCEKCQARIKAEGLKDEHELQSYFVRRMEKFLNDNGRRLIGWDEILEGGLPPNATVQSWRGMEGALAAATTGHDVVASPTSHCYIDYAQGRNPGEPTNMGLITLEKVYSFDPTPEKLTPEQAKHILGIECNMWTEHAPQELVDRQVFPRLCAVAEVGWSPRESRDWRDFTARMETHYRRLDALGVTYYIPPPYPSSDVFAFVDGLEVAFEPPFRAGKIRYTTDGSEPSPSSMLYERPIRLSSTTTVKAKTFLESGRASGIADLKYKKLAPHEPVSPEKTEPGLAYTYHEGNLGRLPDLSKINLVNSGTAASFNLSLRKRDYEYALRFSGFLEIGREGRYTFHVKSDDGSRLWIGDDLIVDNDGRHQAMEVSGPVLLKVGKHPLIVEYFQSHGEHSLIVEYEAEGMRRQELPASMLSHKPSK